MIKWFIGVVFLTLSTACYKDDIVDTQIIDNRLELNIEGTIDQVYLTRVNDNGFATGDRMGIYITDYNGDTPGAIDNADCRASNLLYTFNAENYRWSSNATIYWKDDVTPIDVYGYYPGVEYIANPLEYNYTVSYQQNLEPADSKMSNYEAADFLWGKVTKVYPTEEEIKVTYQHRMAGVMVILENHTNIPAQEWDNLDKSVQVDNTIRRAKIDLTNGIPVPYGDVDNSIMMLAQANDTYRAVVVPQTVDAGKTLISITIDGKSYQHKLTDDMVYNMGKLHKFTISVYSSEDGDFEFKMSNTEIQEWINDETSHEFDSNSYVVINVPEAGMMEQIVTDLGYDPKEIENLKITGTLTNTDFDYIHNTMKSTIRSINIRDVKFVNVFKYHNYNEWKDYFGDDYLPNNAFNGMENLRQVVLPSKIKEIGNSSFREVRLSSPIIIPEGVTHVHEYAFWGCDAEIVMPHSLEYIGGAAFHSNTLKGEVVLTDKIKYIGGSAFETACGLTGTFYMPQYIEQLGENAFNGLGNNDIVGDIIIPPTMTEIPGGAFRINFAPCGTKLILHDGVVRIGDSSFANVRISNNVDWPDGLMFIEKNAFWGSTLRVKDFKFPPNIKKLTHGSFNFAQISGELVLPETLSYIDAVFNCTSITSVVIGDSYVYIGEGAFSSNGQLQKVHIGKNVEFIGKRAFIDHSINTIVCMAKEPPVLGENAFDLAFDKCVLQVPESSVDKYRNTSGWSNFKNITAYKELAFNIPEITTLDKGVVRHGIIRAEGEWEVSECPDWVTVSPSQGDGKEELTITVKSQPVGSETREGKIIFSLKGKDYTTYTDVCQIGGAIGEDEQVVLQTATKGNKAIPLFLVGEGYCAQDVVNGKYLEDMCKQMEYFFSIEPLKSYRDYFTVSTAYAVSPEPLGGVTRFESELYGSLHGNNNMVRDYARTYGVGIDGNEQNTTVLVLFNNDITVNSTHLEDDGFAISWMGQSQDQYPYDQQGYILHEFAGRAFAKLGPENIAHLTFIEACLCPGCTLNGEYNRAKQNGWWQNIDKTNKLHQLPWKHLIFHEKYASIVDVYEGGCGHSRGVYRSENQSVMGNAYVHYFNTISRETIVRRIMDCAGEEFNFEEFVANDIIELPEE